MPPPVPESKPISNDTCGKVYALLPKAVGLALGTPPILDHLAFLRSAKGEGWAGPEDVLESHHVDGSG